MSDHYRTAPVNTAMGNMPRSVFVELTPELWGKLDAIARENDRSKSKLVSALIGNFVANYSKKKIKLPPAPLPQPKPAAIAKARGKHLDKMLSTLYGG